MPVASLAAATAPVAASVATPTTLPTAFLALLITPGEERFDVDFFLRALFLLALLALLPLAAREDDDFLDAVLLLREAAVFAELLDAFFVGTL